MLKCRNGYVTHVGFISLFLGLWYGNCIDSIPWSFNRGGRWGKKIGNKVNTCMLYRKVNNKKNNFPTSPKWIQDWLQNILILITFTCVFPFPWYFSPFSNNRSRRQSSETFSDILWPTSLFSSFLETSVFSSKQSQEPGQPWG